MLSVVCRDSIKQSEIILIIYGLHCIIFLYSLYTFNACMNYTFVLSPGVIGCSFFSLVNVIRIPLCHCVCVCVWVCVCVSV